VNIFTLGHRAWSSLANRIRNHIARQILNPHLVEPAREPPLSWCSTSHPWSVTYRHHGKVSDKCSTIAGYAI
jgi:hypothetical protein